MAMDVPRVRGPRGELPLRSYQMLRSRREPEELLLRRVLYGISCRNYEAAAGAVPGAIGLSSSSVSDHLCLLSKLPSPHLCRAFRFNLRLSHQAAG